MRSGSVWFTWLKCGNHFALLLLGGVSLFLFFVFLFCFVSQAFTTMLAKGGDFCVCVCVDVLGNTLMVG